MQPPELMSKEGRKRQRRIEKFEKLKKSKFAKLKLEKRDFASEITKIRPPCSFF